MLFLEFPASLGTVRQARPGSAEAFHNRHLSIDLLQLLEEHTHQALSVPLQSALFGVGLHVGPEEGKAPMPTESKTPHKVQG